ncbi:MAG: hypothetical protein JF587_07670 [Catenulisporales bacterium]|nr:hypothetical protein [Catenulisporales bacterium]
MGTSAVGAGVAVNAVVVGAGGVVGAGLLDEVPRRLGDAPDEARLPPPLEHPVAATASVVSSTELTANRRLPPDFLRSIPTPVPSVIAGTAELERTVHQTGPTIFNGKTTGISAAFADRRATGRSAADQRAGLRRLSAAPQPTPAAAQPHPAWHHV